MAILPRRRDLMAESKLNMAGGSYSMGPTMRPGEYYAEAGNNQMSNIPGLDLPPVGANVRAGFDANAALKAGRMFRTRAQEQDLQRMAKAQDRLQSQRSRMDKLAMTQEGRKRAEAAEAAPAEREARLLAKHQRDLQQIRAAKVEPAAVKARSEAEQAQSNVTQKEADRAQHGELTREGFTVTREGHAVTKDVAKQQIESREMIAEENRKAAELKDKIVTGRATQKEITDRRNQLADNARKLQVLGAEHPELAPTLRSAVRAIEAEAAGLGASPVAAPAAPPAAGATGQSAATAPVANAPAAAAAAQPAAAGVDANQNSIPDNLESFIGKLAQLEMSANPVDQDKALMGRQKMIRSGVSEDAVTRAIKAYNAAQNAKAK